MYKRWDKIVFIQNVGLTKEGEKGVINKIETRKDTVLSIQVGTDEGRYYNFHPDDIYDYVALDCKLRKALL